MKSPFFGVQLQVSVHYMRLWVLCRLDTMDMQEGQTRTHWCMYGNKTISVLSTAAWDLNTIKL